MKTWTYLEAATKVLGDCDLQDAAFITSNELIGYFNEAISEAEAEIHGTREEYFLKRYNIPLVSGQNTYAFPDDIYIRKIRGIVYSNQTTIYDVKKLKIWHKFNRISLTENFGLNDDYQYYTTNDSPGNDNIILLPKSRETAILPQVLLGNSTQFTPMILWYMRAAQRIPLVGELIKDWETYILPASVNTTTDVVTLTQTGYVTGDQVQLFPFAAPGGASGLPAPLVAGATYFVITTGTAGQVKLATTAANAAAGTAIDLTTTGSATGYFNVSVAATTSYINAMIMDIPDFMTFQVQWVKCRCFEKEGDPRLDGAVVTLEKQREQLVNTLKEMVIDNDTEIEADFTHYWEMS